MSQMITLDLAVIKVIFKVSIPIVSLVWFLYTSITSFYILRLQSTSHSLTILGYKVIRIDLTIAVKSSKLMWGINTFFHERARTNNKNDIKTVQKFGNWSFSFAGNPRATGNKQSKVGCDRLEVWRHVLQFQRKRCHWICRCLQEKSGWRG